MKKVAVIGLGSVSHRHRRNLRSLFPDADLYAMSASGRIPTEEISDCDHLALSVDELIDAEVELVIVASPASFHAKHALLFITAAIPTFIEKPVTAEYHDVLLLQKVASKYKTPIAIGYCLRYLPSAQIMKKLLDDKKVGELYNAFIQIGQYLPDWRPTKDYRDCVSSNPALGGGALLELSHELDYCQWLLGELKVEHVLLRSSDELGLSVEDIADITLMTQSGTIAHVHLDFIQKKAHRVCSFIGSEGRLDWDLITNSVRFSSKEGDVLIYAEPNWDKNKMYLSMLEDFIDQIKGKPHRCVSLSEAEKTVHLIEKIKRYKNK